MNTLLANTVVVTTSIGNASNTSNSYTKFIQTISARNEETLLINTKQNSYVSGEASFREELFFQGILEDTA